MNSLIIVEVVDPNTFVVFLQFYTVSYFIFSYNIHHPGFLTDGFIHWIGEADLTQFAKSNILNLKTLILNIALAFNHGRPCLHTHHPGSSNKYHRSAYPCPD